MGEQVNRLNKAALLQGRDQVFYEYFEELDGEIALAPLTDGQYSQAEAVRATGASMSGRPVMDKDGNVDRAATSGQLEFKIDMQAAANADFEADCLAVAYSLSNGSGEQWTDREVKALQPPGIVHKIAAKVYEISGANQQQIEQVRSFRGKRGGAEHDKPSSGKRSAGKKSS